MSTTTLLTSVTTNAKLSRRAWAVVVMLILFQIVNFADKAVLGLVAPKAIPDLGITAVQFGFIASAFYFLYSLVSIIVGFIATRISIKWIILAMGLTWALMQFPMLLGGGAAALLATRIILGAAEGPATAVSLTSAHGWFEPRKRALPSNLVAAGSTIGPVIAAPLLTWILISFGWRWAFGALGIVGLVWTVLWLLIGANGPYAGVGRRITADETTDTLVGVEGVASPDAQPVAGDATNAVDAQPAVKLVPAMLSLTFIAACIGGFTNFWVMGFYTTWLPNYLNTVIGLDLPRVGFVSTFPWLIGAGVLLLLGLIGQRLLKAGRTVHLAISVPFGVAALIAGTCFLLAPHSAGMVAVGLLSIAGGCSLAFPMTASALGYMVGAKQRPILMATLGAVASLGAVISPSLVAQLIARAGYVAPAKGQPLTVQMAEAMGSGVNTAFTITGIVLIVGGVLAVALLRPEASARRLQALHRR